MKRASICVDDSSSYGVYASEAVKSFYVHDPLKSVKSEEYAVDLIKKINKICTAGGFNLKKSICNRKNVLMSISDIHRREGVKDTDLEKKCSIQKNLWEYTGILKKMLYVSR